MLRLERVGLNNGKVDALVAFIFNHGSAELYCSRLGHKRNREEHDAVSAQRMHCA